MSRIDRIEIRKFTDDIPDHERDYSSDRTTGTMAYRKGAVVKRPGLMVRVKTDDGLVGEYANWMPSGTLDTALSAAKLALGRDWTQRERIWRNARRSARPVNSYGLSYVDMALWDLAGKAAGQSLTQMLGGWRPRVAAYASSQNGDRSGGLDSKEAVSEFFASLKKRGFRGFKMHSWDDGNVREEIDNVHLMRETLGDDVELMLDPACVFNSLHDAIQVGKACAEARFRWFEDPLRPTGMGVFQHRKLREAIDIPVLQTEHVPGPEAKADFLLAGGTDLLRVDCHYDLGITGALKTMHFGESLGVSVEFHAPSPVHRHLAATQQATTLYEVANVSPAMSDPSPKIYACTYSDDVSTIGADGTLAVPHAPGIGVDYDYEKIVAQSVEDHVLSLRGEGEVLQLRDA